MEALIIDDAYENEPALWDSQCKWRGEGTGLGLTSACLPLPGRFDLWPLWSYMIRSITVIVLLISSTQPNSQSCTDSQQIHDTTFQSYTTRTKLYCTTKLYNIPQQNQTSGMKMRMQMFNVQQKIDRKSRFSLYCTNQTKKLMPKTKKKTIEQSRK